LEDPIYSTWEFQYLVTNTIGQDSKEPLDEKYFPFRQVHRCRIYYNRTEIYKTITKVPYIQLYLVETNCSEYALD